MPDADSRGLLAGRARARAFLVVWLTWQAQRMALDPIVSLSVAIAEAPGSYAVFVGSGVSRDAGVPTGSEVLWQAVGALYRRENATAETPDRGDCLAQLGPLSAAATITIETWTMPA